MAMSTANPGVVWIHNDDGNDRHLYAFRTNGSLLATFDYNLNLGDVEDMAVGPGPGGASYLYVGDIGGADKPGEVRSSVIIVRIPEPFVSLSWASNPFIDLNFTGVQFFFLEYPDGSFDAETLMVDPVSGDVLVGTKQNNGTRIYRANLNAVANADTVMMSYVLTVPFGSASGGAISPTGGRIALRRENAAMMWIRCEGESVSNALTRAGHAIPIIGPPTEPNGEAITFVPNGTGYLTVSDSVINPPINFFPALCSLTAVGTEITQHPQSVQVEAGADVQLTAAASGTNLTYQWLLGGSPISGANAPTLLLTNVQPAQGGSYSLFVSGDGGTDVSSPATLSVITLPPVILSQPPPISLAATGSTVQLSVVLQGTLPFNFLWTQNKRPLVATSSTLTLQNVQKANGGKYRVVVSNSAGQATSGDALLKILFPPVILLNPQSKTNLIGSKVTLKARAKGSPRLGYQWFFNDAPIAGAIKPQLVLQDVQPAQSGNYFVTISNAVGAVTSSVAEIFVQ